MAGIPRVTAVAFLVGTLLSGCSEPGTGGLIGTWLGSTEQLNPGFERLEVQFTQSGRFRYGIEKYGLYPVQSSDDLSGYTRIEGSVQVVNDQLIFTIERRVTWDLVIYGPDAPEIVEEPYPGPRTLEDAHYTVEEDVLTLEYTDWGGGLPMGVTTQLSRAP